MGVIGKYHECFIHETPSTYIVTNEHGRTIGQSMTVPGCEGLIDEYRDTHPLQSTEIKNIYPNGYSLEDRPGHSFVRGTFKSVKKAKIYAEENNLSWWRIVAYNDETNTIDVIEEKN